LNVFSDIESKTPTSDPVVSQLALIAMEVALAELWQCHGINPNVMIGHSLGEYAAMCIAGVISLTDMFYLVGHRARLMQEHCTLGSHAMLVTNTDSSRLKQMIVDWNIESCEIACCNGPDSTSVSGPIEKLDVLKDRLKQLGLKAALLQVPYAFHSAQIEPILTKFGVLAQAIDFSQPSIPIVSTLLAKVVSEPGIFSANYLVKQTRETVQFSLAVAEAQALVNDQTVWIEIGPGSSCLTMVRSILGLSTGLTLPSLNQQEDDWMCVSKGLATAYTAGLQVEWKSFHEPYKEALCLLDLPRYAFDNKRHWIKYKGDWSITKSHGQREPANHMLSTTGLSPALPNLAVKTPSATQLSLSCSTPKHATAALNSIGKPPEVIFPSAVDMPVGRALPAPTGHISTVNDPSVAWDKSRPPSMSPSNSDTSGNRLEKFTSSPKGLEQQFKSIIARETESPLDEIQPHVAFANLGVDSLLGISMREAVEREMGLSLLPSFFMHNVNDAMNFLESITNKPQAI
jgi:acyl transferase domain-containing protein